MLKKFEFVPGGSRYFWREGPTKKKWAMENYSIEKVIGKGIFYLVRLIKKALTGLYIWLVAKKMNKNTF